MKTCFTFLLAFFWCLFTYAQTNPSPQSLPYSQDFSSFTGSTTTFPVGIQGWTIAGSTTTTYPLAIPNGDQPLAGATNASTSGFVGDMNGKIGFLCTGSAIKAIALSIITTNLTNISVSYIAATQRQQTTARTGAIGLQYRIGTSGVFTNTSAADYQNPNTIDNLTGTNSLSPTTISVTLPPACENQAIVQLRWVYKEVGTNTGNRPSFSIDNISITGGITLSTNANLSNLVLSSGSLNTTFTAETTSYTASVANSVSSITVTPTAADANSTIKINGTTVASTTASQAIPLNVGNNTITTIVTAQDGSTTKTYTVIVNRAAAGVATFTTTSPLASFGNVCINTTTSPNSFTINGSNLDGTNISLAALSGFSYSETSAGTYTNTLSFTYTGSSFTGKIIYVKFNPTAVQAYDGNIILSGGSISSYSVAAAGSGINTSATISTATPATSVTATTARTGGNIVAGCSAVSSYGIEYSLNTGFANGTGTQVAANNLSGGNFSTTITGLAPNTKYYYRAYAVSGGTTSYGTEQSFVNTPLPVLLSSQPGLSFTETFTDIATWGNFFISTTAGSGANHFGGLSSNATAGSGIGVPSPTVLTASTNSFQGATFLSSGGVQRGTDQAPATQSIVLLSTGGTDNQTSAAIDFYMDFTGLNAGTLSFDWASVNNSTGDRNGSMKVYTSTDGTTFTELVNASVLNFTNNSPTSNTKSNIPLPASFNNSATARIRFYYYNATGGITPTGSRPKISIDNLNVTAVATTPCASPTAPATALAFGTITDVTIQGSFTAATGTADNYMIVASTNSSLTNKPDNGQIYNLGDNVGDGTVVAKGSATNFTASGLNASTTYYFFVFPVNSICTGGPLYYSTNILTGQATTVAGLPPCAAPAAQATNYVVGTSGVNTLQGSFTATTADEFLVLVSKSATFTGTITNGSTYNTGDVIGNATVVQRSNATSFTASGLTAGTPYYFYIFSDNLSACVNGPAYNVASPLTSGAQPTNPLPPCAAPTAQPTQLTFNASNTVISGAFTPGGGADNYLVVMSTSATSTPTPINGTDYANGTNLGGGTVVANSASTSFAATNLIAGTQYYFYIFSANRNCSGGTQYISTNPLKGSISTSNNAVNNYYFGSLHSHSDYSDGNQDKQGQGYTPATDYAYAITANCMDFLGISEHNHYSGGDPGNLVGTYHMGSTQANNFTAANPGFLALYGMEWGVISGGGHVVVYGDGMDKLFGWESGSGVWGPTDNYDVYVPKNTYTDHATGLFKTVNDNIATNTFATLAHPNLTDFNNLAQTAYDAAADSAITGCAVESGPATSTNQTYSNPGASLSYLWYWQTLLSKGYHLGPTIDHDNHNTTFGHATHSRTAVVAPALTKTELVSAMRNMHYYATQDCDSKVDFTINTKMMGSIITDRYAPIITVSITDATNDASKSIIKIMHGVPGSGVLAEKLDSIIGSSFSYADNSLANLATGYYYADITNGTSRIVTSPIWYTRNDNSLLPVKFTSFSAQKISTNVRLNWTTALETNSSLFAIERSTDAKTWLEIGTLNAAGTTTLPTDYIYYDYAPTNGVNYYRLKQVDIDGKYQYSATQSVLFASTGTQILISPNPTKDFINIYLSNASNETYHVQLTDTNGKVLKNIISTEQHLQINTSALAKGIYFIKLINNNAVTTKKIVIE